MRKFDYLIKILLLLSITFFVYSCAVNPVTGKKELMLVSAEQEKAMGQQYDPQVISEFGLYEAPDLQRFIEAKGKEIGKNSHMPDLDFKFRILDSPVINAFAVPGGYVYFTRGILGHFNSEAELIGVLGHEMGHVTARHSASQQSKQQAAQLGLIAGMIAVPEVANYGQQLMQGMQLLFLKYSRDDETQADELGVLYSTRVGYDAKQMANFFNVLNKQAMASESGGVPTFFSTHPNPANRYEKVKRQAKELQSQVPNTNWKVNTNSYLRMIDGIVYGEDPRQGFVENNIFYHPELRFKYNIPNGWMHQNTPSSVKMAPKDNKAMMIFTLAQGSNLKEAAENSLKQLKLDVQNSKSTKVNGMPSIAVLSQQVNQDQQGQQQTIKVLSYFIEYNNNYYAFHGISSNADFNNYARTMESVMNTFNVLRDQSKINKQPQRIKVMTVKRTSTVADAFKSFGVSSKDMEKFALLNNMELNDRVETGTLLKIVR